MRVADAQYRSPEHLTAQRLGMNHRAHVGNGEKICDVVLAGLDIDFDFGKACHVGKRLAVVRILVLGRRHQTLSRQRGNGCLGVLVYVFGRFVTVVDAAQLDRTLRRLRQVSCSRLRLCGRRARWRPHTAPACRRESWRQFPAVSVSHPWRRRMPRGSWRASSGCHRRRRSRAGSSRCCPR